MKDTIMLSLDTSLHNTGITVWKNGKWECTLLLNDELWKTEYKDTNVRYPDLRDVTLVNSEKMMEMVFDLINSYKPSIIVIERPVVLKNAKTQSGLDRLVGCIEFLCLINDIDYQEFRPSEWRALIEDDNKPNKSKKDLWKQWALSVVPKKIADLGDDCAESYLIGKAYINLMKKALPI